ncbi:MAG: metallophosphoesterase [Clostridia bacterium]|nr:metallophosphoesterase [Clostridia bacterium]
MITLKKESGKDFKILNLTDTQLASNEWEEGHKNRAILIHTLTELVKEVQPDLITVTGDLAWSGETLAYDSLADLLDSFEIPWAPVWGNHDNQGGAESIEALVERYLSHPYCIYEKGDPALGNGNYVIAIEEDGKIVEGVIMMDSHDRMPFVESDGTEREAWAKLIPEQLVWYREQIEMLNSLGCKDTTVMMHIPIYAYNDAWNAAFNTKVDPAAVTPEKSADSANWNEGYTDSFGVKYEGICSYPADEGMFDVILELGSTKHVVSGHDHVNSFVIPYKGVKLIYGLKTGAGCYWKPELNGGTVFRVTEEGVSDLWHQYVDVSALV